MSDKYDYDLLFAVAGDAIIENRLDTAEEMVKSEGLRQDPHRIQGYDEFGMYRDIRICGVDVKLRWIPIGEGVMGSPEDEAGRWDDEGPQHYTVCTEGFWMMETAVTQELWTAVMGSNPSHFSQGEDAPRRPVERVSWNDCLQFIEKIHELHPELDLEFNLPTEHQWEYAARAGSTESRYGALDEIAWYYRNSDNTTHPVGLKQPNPWGLYDMLGNVYEWCKDSTGYPLKEYDVPDEAIVKPE
jgi:sulfatase modifying factor 1